MATDNTLKVGIVQISTLPACRFPRHKDSAEANFVHGEQEPFFFNLSLRAAPAVHKTLTAVGPRRFPSVSQDLNEFSANYPKALASMLEVVVRAAKRSGVEVLVFPEYSIPWRALPQVETLANEHEMVIVGGSHGLTRAEVEDHVYATTIRAELPEHWSSTTICPIYLPGQDTPTLHYKRIANAGERMIASPDRKRSDAIDLEVTTGHKSGLRVMFASDFVADIEASADEHARERIRDFLHNTGLGVLVGFQPSPQNLEERVLGLLTHRRDAKTTVAFANTAVHGGSFIVCRSDQGHPQQGKIPPEPGLSCIYAREVIVGSSGPEQPFYPPITRVICPRSKIQERLWRELEQATEQASEGDSRPTMTRLIKDNIPPALRVFYSVLEDACADRAPAVQLEGSAHDLRNSILLDPEQSLAALVQRLYFAHFHYFSEVLKGADWSTTYRAVVALIVERIDDCKAADMVDLEERSAESFDRLKDRPVEIEEPSSPASSDDELERWISADVDGEGHKFGFRVTDIPHEDYGIAYQARFIGQVIELLYKSAYVRSLELNVVKTNLERSSDEKHLSAMNVFLVFSLAPGLEEDEANTLAHELYRICADRLLTFRLKPLDLDGDWYKDFGHVRDAEVNEYYLARSTSIEGKEFAFVGRGEAASILKLQASLEQPSRLSIRLDSATPEAQQQELIWNTDTSELIGLDSGRLRGVIQTQILDLQDLQEAYMTTQFQPQQFRPESCGGVKPTIPARVVFEIGSTDLQAVPDMVAYELTGPGRYRTVREPTEMVLAEREIYHIFRLPFGANLPGFVGRNRQFSLLDEDLPPTGNGLLLGKVDTKKAGPQKFYLSDEARRRHMWIIGKTGTGKSYFMGSLISRDIEAGKGLIVIDPHGDLVDMVLARVPPNRAGDVILFDPASRNSPPGLNLFDTDLSDGVQRSLVMEEAVHMFTRLYGYKIFGPRIQQYFRGAVMSIMDYGQARNIRPTLLDVSRIFLDSDYRSEVRKHTIDPVARLFWREFDSTDAREKREMIPFFQSKFGPLLSNQLIRRVIGQRRSTVRMRDVFGSSAIVLVRLSKGLIGDINSSLLGMVFMAQIYSAAMAQAEFDVAQRNTFALYVDEFQNYASETFSTLLGEARKYGLSMTLANQYIDQLAIDSRERKINAEALIQGLTGNVSTIVAFQLGNKDADRLSHEMRPPEDTRRSSMFDAQKTSHAIARALTGLERYQALLSAQVEGKKLPCTYLYSGKWEGFDSPVYGQKLAAFLKLRYCPVGDDIEEEIRRNLDGLIVNNKQDGNERQLKARRS